MDHEDLKTMLGEYISEMKNHEEKYMGFPNNMSYDYEAVAQSAHVYINNAGDPFSTLSWKKHSKHFEQEVVHFFLDLYRLPRKLGWGYVTSGGTEGNMEGILLGREIYPKATLYYSEDTHYSIGKIARILRMKTKVIRSQKNGEIDYKDFEKQLSLNKAKEAVVVVNCGTTVKGAFDNLTRIQSILAKQNIQKKYIHVDAALSGMILPFVETAPRYSFDKGVDSVAISMHKFFGVPLISGVVFTKKKYVEHVKQSIEYINSHDTTISGSRNGHTALYTWYIIKKHGMEKFKSDAHACLENARYLHGRLQSEGVCAFLNPYSNTVYFNKPDEEVVRKWQLSCSGDTAHVVVMQHVDKKKIDHLVTDIVLN